MILIIYTQRSKKTLMYLDNLKKKVLKMDTCLNIVRTLLKRHHVRRWFASVACGAEEMEGECGRGSKGGERLLCVTTYDAAPSSVVHSWDTQQRKTMHFKEAWR